MKNRSFLDCEDDFYGLTRCFFIAAKEIQKTISRFAPSMPVKFFLTKGVTFRHRPGILYQMQEAHAFIKRDIG